MSRGCVCGHVVEYHDYTPEEDEYGNRVPGPGTTECHGNAANRPPHNTPCPCDGYDRRDP